MKKVVLITGVSSGFGKQMARLLADKDYLVYGTVRKSIPFEGKVNHLYMDMTKPESIKSAVSEIIQKEGRIDVLINNAGMHSGGPIETTPIETIKLQMETNFMGVVHLTREVLPIMRQQGGGTIVNISSIGGLMGLPFQGYYSAGKFAIEGFSEALRMEVNQFKIKVILINPGDFHTNNTQNRKDFLASSTPDGAYDEQFSKTLAVVEKDETNGWKPEILAGKIIRIIESKNPKQRYIIASFEQKLAVVLKYILPAKFFRAILQDHYKIK